MTKRPSAYHWDTASTNCSEFLTPGRTEAIRHYNSEPPECCTATFIFFCSLKLKENLHSILIRVIGYIFACDCQ
jgi:hypothetical protein